MAAATCPKCGARFAVSPGEKPVCPGCGQKFKVSKSPAPPELPAEAPPLPSEPAIVPTEKIEPTAKEPAPQPQPETHPVAPQSPEPPPTPLAPYQPSAVAAPIRKTSFEPRKYPAMRAIILVLYILAALTAASFMFSVGFVILTLIGGIATSENWRLATGMGIVGAMTFLAASLFTHTILLLIFMGSAESIRIWLDIQQNTQETAFYARLNRDWT